MSTPSITGTDTGSDTTADSERTWVTICPLATVPFERGICALVETEQVAIFRSSPASPTASTDLYAISNFDPFSESYVLSRGIMGDRQGILKVASPIYKHNFDLRTGMCLEDENVQIPVYPVRIIETDGTEVVQIGMFAHSLQLPASPPFTDSNPGEARKALPGSEETRLRLPRSHI